ncbi:YbhN family protein [Streptomyces anandii]|uniref:lysylphosphatidylglycerol synthase transmembrane domain-containing protein n=1 Tax=Streptomyces anandii TaxID=285454 RepID=UPI0036FE1F2B
MSVQTLDALMVRAADPAQPDGRGIQDASGDRGTDAEQGGLRPRALLARLNTRALRTHFGTVSGVAILAVLLWRLGTGVFLQGLRRIDVPTLVAALAVGLVTTVFSAWRWQLVARALRIRLPLGAAVADYYRALFLNAALPGGVLGDVHRAVRHGQSAGDIGRGVRAVVLERVAGQITLAVTGAAVLLTLPSPVRADARQFAPLAALAAAGVFAVLLALRMNRPSSRGGRAVRRTLGELREGLLSRRNGPGVALSSVVVLAGHVVMFVVAARVAGSPAPVAVLLPLAVLALVAMGLPLNVGGFGPREGATAWAFGAAGLGASTGLAVAVVYGVLSFVAALPGALVLVARWYTGLRARTASAAPSGAYSDEPPLAEGEFAGSAPAPAPVSLSALVPAPEVSNSKYGAKAPARLASSSFPFSAEPREGRPMTPDSV